MGAQDFNDVTNPGAAPGEPSVVAEDSEDEFPSDQTRIDPAFMSASAPARPKSASGSLESLAAARAQAQREAPAAPQRERPARANSNNKLAALQSLSLDGGSSGSSTRLPPAPRQQGGGGTLPWVLLVLLGIGYGGKVYWWDKNHGADKQVGEQAAIRVETVQASGGSGQTHVAAGFTNARDPITIGAPSGGLVKQVRVQNNDRITKGEVLVEMDSSAAQAELSAVHTEVAEMEGAYRQKEMLLKAGAATAVEVAQAKSAIAISKAKERAPEQRIQQARVHSTITGSVLEVLVHPGETVPINGPVVKIADLRNLVAEVDITEADIVKIKRGQQVDVTSDAFPGKVFKGTVWFISAQADKARGTIQVRVELAPSDELNKTQMSVKCTFLPVQGEAPHIFVSRTAVTPQNTVFVVGTNRVATSRPVKTGASQGASIEILSGVAAGEQIVTDAMSVHDGQQLPQ